MESGASSRLKQDPIGRPRRKRPSVFHTFIRDYQQNSTQQLSCLAGVIRGHLWLRRALRSNQAKWCSNGTRKILITLQAAASPYWSSACAHTGSRFIVEHITVQAMWSSPTQYDTTRIRVFKGHDASISGI